MKPTNRILLAIIRAYDALVRDRLFMEDHGWTLAAYVERYGTTQVPVLGDGGPLIWKADIQNHGRLRHDFITLIEPYIQHEVPFLPINTLALYREMLKPNADLNFEKLLRQTAAIDNKGFIRPIV